MGLFIMALVAIGVLAFIHYLSGSIWIAGAVAVLFFGLWFFSNIRASTSGLVKANMHAYFSARLRGASHNKAIENVINTRYPISSNNRQRVAALLQTNQPYASQEEEVKELICLIFECELGGRPSLKGQIKIWKIADQVYKQMESQMISSDKTA